MVVSWRSEVKYLAQDCGGEGVVFGADLLANNLFIISADYIRAAVWDLVDVCAEKLWTDMPITFFACNFVRIHVSFESALVFYFRRNINILLGCG